MVNKLSRFIRDFLILDATILLKPNLNQKYLE